ncbi:unnamed protein product, partial [Meganyctiphanes norvegica]
CPSGFIKISSQCFKMFKDQHRSWSEAKTKCEQEGYILAQPDNSVFVHLRKKLYETYGQGYAWLGAQSDGSKFVYKHGGPVLDNASPLWYPREPANVGAERCLVLLVHDSDMRDQPTSPYWTSPCSTSSSRYTLCE